MSGESDGGKTTPAPAATPTPAATPAPKRKRRWFGKSLLLILWIMVVAGSTVVYLFRSTPQDYKKFQAFLESHTQEEIEVIAVNVEGKFAALMGLGPSTGSGAGEAGEGGQGGLHADIDEVTDPAILFGPRQLIISRDEANAWLTNKLPQWIEKRGYQFPPQISNMMATTEAPNMVLRFALETEEISQVVSMVMDAKFHDGGKVLLQLLSLRGGKMPVPMETLTKVLKGSAAGGRVKEIVDKMAGLSDGAEFDTRFQFDKKRDLTVAGVEFIKDNVRLNMNLVPRRDVTVADAQPGGDPAE